jgi:prepilin-type processing-associated H-X9-DG protein/prepilin-type N-terminal cleavage/methylation domain-containing protein
MCGSSSHRDRLGGFTLVELLVVVGVIAVLIGLLVPALSGARRRAGGITCESNLRQWGMATLMYANENGGFLPRRGQGVGPTAQVTRPTDWFNALPPLMKGLEYGDADPSVRTLISSNSIPRPWDNSVWICPQANDMPGQYYWAFGMNMALSVWEANQNNGQPNKITGVGPTATMVLFADAPGNYCSVYPSKLPDGYNPVPRHNNAVNICFLDGHVEAILGSYIGCDKGVIPRADVRWLPPGSTWNSAQ